VRYFSPDAVFGDMASFLDKLHARNEKISRSAETLDKSSVTGIIYCHERKTCEEVADRLRGRGINALGETDSRCHVVDYNA
jgi:hypothetical protein